MKVRTFGLTLFFGGILAGPIGLATDATAAGPKGPGVAATPHMTPPPMAKAPIPLSPEGLHWGMKPEEAAVLYDRLFDRDYVEKYKAARVTEHPNLDAELRELKATYRRPVTFGDLPTGIDQTPLKGEYNYRHGESMVTVIHEGQKRFLFFVSGYLWKTYDEVPLKPGGDLGTTYKEAIVALQKRFGVSGRVQAADFEHGRAATEVDWGDATTRVRAIDRSGEGIVGLAYEERAMGERIFAWRAGQKPEDHGIDPLIASATKAGAVVDPNQHAADAFTGKAHADQGPAGPPPGPPPPGSPPKKK